MCIRDSLVSVYLIGYFMICNNIYDCLSVNALRSFYEVWWTSSKVQIVSQFFPVYATKSLLKVVEGYVTIKSIFSVKVTRIG